MHQYYDDPGLLVGDSLGYQAQRKAIRLFPGLVAEVLCRQIATMWDLPALGSDAFTVRLIHEILRMPE